MTEITNLPRADRTGLRWLPLGRRELILAAAALIGAGMALNWGWLSAVGAAPLILALAPCAAMCAAGLCMKGGSKSCGNETDPSAGPGQARD